MRVFERNKGQGGKIHSKQANRWSDSEDDLFFRECSDSVFVTELTNLASNRVFGKQQSGFAESEECNIESKQDNWAQTQGEHW